MRTYLHLLLHLFGLGLLACCIAAQAAAAATPNIVYILADDMGLGDVSYNPNSRVPTPNIDSIARDGMRFDNAHSASSVCTPTRYAILTGQYGWRSANPGGNVLFPSGPALIQPSTFTVADMLKESGYTTGAIGKWHVGMNWVTTDGFPAQWNGQNVDYTKPFTGGPIDQGFDTYFGVDAINYPPYSYLRQNRTVGADLQTPTSPGAAVVTPPGGSYAGRQTAGYDLHDVLPTISNEAVGYIGQQATQSNPFFLYLPLTAPHYPIFPMTCPTCSTGQLGAGGTPYGDSIASVDYVVGRVLNALDDPNQDGNTSDSIKNNTMIVFASDNAADTQFSFGTSPGYVNGQLLRGDKETVYEGGSRIPFAVQWNGHIAPQSSTSNFVQLNDFMATTAALVGRSLPAGAAIDSFNLLPTLLGQSSSAIRDSNIVQAAGGAFTITRLDGSGNEMKLVFSPNHGGVTGTATSPLMSNNNPNFSFTQLQMFNLTADPGEHTNLLAGGGTLAAQQTALELKAAMQQYMQTGRTTPAAPLGPILSEKTMRIDFGLNTQATVLTGWNNVSGLQDVEPVVNLNLVDTSGVSTGINFATQWSGTGSDSGINGTAANYSGPYPAEVSGLPESALSDGIYVRDGLKLTMTLSNLDRHAAYDILFYGAAANTGDYSLLTATGTTTQVAFSDLLVNNSSQVGQIIGVMPDDLGKILLAFEGRRQDGSVQSTSINDDGQGRLNFLQIIAHFLAVPGDYNGDRLVTMADYAVWKLHYGTVFAAADGNGNGVVDAGDYTIWRNNLISGGGTASGAGLPQNSTVPEPASWALIAVVAIWGAGRRFRPQR